MSDTDIPSEGGEESLNEVDALNSWLDSLSDEDRDAAREFLADPKAMSRALSSFKSDKEQRTKVREEREAFQLASQKRYDETIAKFEEIDINDPIAVVNWLKELTDVSDEIGLEKKHEDIVRRLKAAGYKNASGKLSLKLRANKEETAKYLIGVALNSLDKGGQIAPVFTIFIDRLNTRSGVSRVFFGVNPSPFSRG